jgi:hypothetical protein
MAGNSFRFAASISRPLGLETKKSWHWTPTDRSLIRQKRLLGQVCTSPELRQTAGESNPCQRIETPAIHPLLYSLLSPCRRVASESASGRETSLPLIPAPRSGTLDFLKLGTLKHSRTSLWIPACAGMNR